MGLNYRNHICSGYLRTLGVWTVVLAALALGVSATSASEDCPLNLSSSIRDKGENESSEPVSNDVTIRSDRVETEGSLTELIGPSTIQTRGSTVITNRAEIDREVGLWKFAEGLAVINPEWRFKAIAAQLNTKDESASLLGAQIEILENYKRVNLNTAAKQSSLVALSQVHLTTCPPGNSSWGLRLQKAIYEESTKTFAAQHVSLRIGTLPLFYVPFLRWREVERKQRLPSPKLDYGSTDGLRIRVPYPIASVTSLPVVLLPEVMTRRGAALGVALPYRDFQVMGRWMPKDRQFNGVLPRRAFDQLDETTKFDPVERWALELKGNQQYESWSLKFQHLATSDLDYVRDFGAEQDSIADLASESSVELTYAKQSLTSRFRAQRFESNIVADTVVQEAPKITVRWRPKWRRIRAESDIDYAQFERTHRNFTQSQSERTHLQQGVSLVMFKRTWADLSASAAIMRTRFDYFTQVRPIRRTETRDISSRSISGVLHMQQSANPMTKIEPRFFYLKRSFKNQEHLPLFDSWIHVFDAWRLFSDKRQSGIDRIPGVHSLTMGFRSYIHNRTANAVAGEVELGLVRHFNYASDSGHEGNTQVGWTANLRSNNRLSFVHSSLLNTADSRIAETHTLSSYRFNERAFATFGYTKHRVLGIEQSHFGFQLPISRRLHMIGAINKDLSHQQDFERIVGIGFDGCCLNWRFVHRDLVKADRYRELVGTKENTKWYLQIELKGLGSIGAKVESLLSARIPGFDVYRN